MEGTVTISIKDFELLRATQAEYQKIIDILEKTLNENGEVEFISDLVNYIETVFP